MSSTLSVKLDIKTSECRVVEVKVQLYNDADKDYYIESRSFVDLDNRLGVSGVSDVSCNLIRALEPSDYQPKSLRIPSKGSLDSEYLPLSNSCNFNHAVSGEYFVIYSASFFIYTDANMTLYDKTYELVGGSSSFELGDMC